MSHASPIGVTKELVSHVLRGFERADPADVGARIRRYARGQAAERLQPAQPLPGKLGTNNRAEFVREEEAAAQ